MNVTFSVPSYPAYREMKTAYDRAQYLEYLQRYEEFSACVLRVQAGSVAACVKGLSVKEDVAGVKRIAEDLAGSAASVVERAVAAVESSVEAAVGGMRGEIEAVERAVGALELKLEAAKIGVQGDPGVAGSGAGGAPVQGASTEGPVVDRFPGLSGRARRRAKVRARRSESVEKPSAAELSSDWRVKQPRAPVHKGFYAECSEDTQRELRESRAAMLVAENKVKALRAEGEAKRLAMQRASRVEEKELEVRRLKVEKELSKAGTCEIPAGFAETVVSSGVADVLSSVTGLSSGSVSPDSSVSVAQVHKVEKLVQGLCERLVAAERKVAAEKPKVASDRPGARGRAVSSCECGGVSCCGSAMSASDKRRLAFLERRMEQVNTEAFKKYSEDTPLKQ